VFAVPQHKVSITKTRADWLWSLPKPYTRLSTLNTFIPIDDIIWTKVILVAPLVTAACNMIK